MLRRAKEFQPCSTIGQDTLKKFIVCLLCVTLCTLFPLPMILTGQHVKPSAISMGLNYHQLPVPREAGKDWKGGKQLVDSVQGA